MCQNITSDYQVYSVIPVSQVSHLKLEFFSNLLKITDKVLTSTVYLKLKTYWESRRCSLFSSGAYLPL